MALRDELSNERQGIVSAEHMTQQLLLIPEAPVLLALLLIGWAYDFPPVVGILTFLVIAFFIVRLGLLWTAARQLEHARYHIADRLVRLALRIYPWSADTLAIRARSLSAQGDDLAAEQMLRRAAHFAPGNAYIHGALAGTLLQRGEYRAARAEAIFARQLAASPLALQHLAWLALHVDHDPAKAQRLLQNAEPERLEAPLAAPMMVLWAEAQLARDAVDAALRTMARIEGVLGACPLPQQAELAYHLGRLHAAAGQDGGTYYRRSLDLDPQGRHAHDAWRAMVNPHRTHDRRQQAGSRRQGGGG